MSKVEMKTSYIVLTLCSCISCITLLAQTTQTTSPPPLDMLTKVIGIGSVLVGAFVGYISLRTANEINKVKADFNEAINRVKIEFTKIIHDEGQKQRSEHIATIKELEARVANRHDLNNMQQNIALQLENIKLDLMMKIEKEAKK